jgi:hypothetical protein
MEPDCETSATRPLGSASASKAALVVNAMRSWVLITPIEFGPSSRIPAAFAAATTRACNAAPSGPASAKPSASTHATGIPRAAQAVTCASTCSVPSRI